MSRFESVVKSGSTPHALVAPGAWTVLALTVAAWGAPAHAQEAPTRSGASVQVLDQVVLTGTRKLDRTLAQSESPVDVITAQELQRSGSAELATALAQLLPSLNFPRPSLTDASDAVRPAQLRGLSPDQTLVLVNGKRRHTSAVVNINGSQGRGSSAVDLNAIPIAAVDHIEVLRDGAAAQYGSDAIAGVINIVLKRGARGGAANLAVGQSDAGDGRHAAADASLGLQWGQDAWLRLAVESRHQQRTNRAGVDSRDAASEPRKGQINNRLGDPDSHQQSVLLNGQWDLAPETQAYVQSAYSQRRTTTAAFWRTKATAVANKVDGLYPEGFLPLEVSATQDASLVLGVKGRAAEWQWDVSAQQGGNRFDIEVQNTANYALGAQSPKQFQAGGLRNQQRLLNVDLSRDVNVGARSPWLLGLGAEWREERYQVVAGEPASYQGGGASGYPGFQPSNAGQFQRTNTALYAALEGELSASWSASVALRGERYSDFGSATAAKVSTRYALSPELALRGTLTTGFRAPSLAQQHFATTSTNLINGQLVEAGTFPVGSPAAKALGASPLQAETSRSVSVGAQWQPSSAWLTTVDAYQIDIDHRVLLSANLSLPAALRSTLAAQGVNVSAGRYFTNALDTRTRGLDVVSTWRQRWADAGQTVWSLAYNRTDNTVRRVDDNPAVLTANKLTLIDRVTLARATVSAPDSKWVLSAEHQWGAWSARLGATRYGAFTVRQGDPALDQTFNPAWVLDTAVTWTQGPWQASLVVDNLNNRYPDRVLAANSVGGILQYSSFSPFGFNGRQYTGKLSYRW